ncbi:hypothetical protein ACP4OV_005714 [Aristida adscensionis]
MFVFDTTEGCQLGVTSLLIVPDSNLGPWSMIVGTCQLKTAITRDNSRSDTASIRDTLEVFAEMYSKDPNNVPDYVRRHLLSLSVWEELRGSKVAGWQLHRTPQKTAAVTYYFLVANGIFILDEEHFQEQHAEGDFWHTCIMALPVAPIEIVCANDSTSGRAFWMPVAEVLNYGQGITQNPLASSTRCCMRVGWRFLLFCHSRVGFAKMPPWRNDTAGLLIIVALATSNLLA